MTDCIHSLRGGHVATQATGLKVELFEGVGGGNQYGTGLLPVRGGHRSD
jgi:hypothetical protein